MDIPVVIEELPDHRYRARSGEPFGLSAESSTEGEALTSLERLMRDRLANGVKLTVVGLPAAEVNPWVQLAGMFQDDPQFDEFLEAMKEYRREVEAAEEP